MQNHCAARSGADAAPHPAQHSQGHTVDRQSTMLSLPHSRQRRRAYVEFFWQDKTANLSKHEKAHRTKQFGVRGILVDWQFQRSS